MSNGLLAIALRTMAVGMRAQADQLTQLAMQIDPPVRKEPDHAYGLLRPVTAPPREPGFDKPGPYRGEQEIIQPNILPVRNADGNIIGTIPMRD